MSKDASRATLIDELQNFADRLGKTPSATDLREDEKTPSRYQYRKQFGKWNQALEAAGLEPNQVYEYDRNSLLDELVDLTRTLGRVPSEQDMDDRGRYSSAPYRDQFGDWDSALEELGLRWERDRPRNAPSNRDLVEYLREMANYHNQGKTATLSKRDLPDGGHAYTTYLDRFGSWREALAAAGLPFPEQGYDREEILEAIRDVASNFDKSPGDSGPTYEQFVEHGEISTSPIHREFSFWNEAVREAGFEPHTGGRPQGTNEYTTGFLLAELRRVADEMDCTPTHEQFDKKSEVNWKTVAKRFGSWNRALRMVGYQPTRKSGKEPANRSQGAGVVARSVSDPKVETIAIDTTQRFHLSTGDLLFDERSDLGYEIVDIKCKSKALEPDWAVRGLLLNKSDTHYYRRFWPDELEEGLQDWLLKVIG